MRAVRKPHRRRCTRELFHRDHVSEVTESGAPPFFVDRDPEKPELAQSRPQVARELVRAVDFRRPRRDLGGCERAHRFAEDVDGFPETKIETCNLAHTPTSGPP